LSTKRRYPVWDNAKKEFYHGTTKRHADAILRDGIDPSRGEPNTDFGRGFYTTTNRAQAEEWAESKASDSGDEPVVLKVTIDRAALAKLRHLVFTRPTSDYWSLVERCRDDDDVPHPTGDDYDVVYGPVAKRWWGSKAYTTIRDYDQTSFHGDAAKSLLNDRTLCKVEVAK
jgi:Protein of unknown function (DUF3990)